MRSIPIFVLAIAVACRGPMEPPLPADAVMITPPKVYAAWWEMVQACSGGTRPMSDITWYVVPDVPLINVQGRFAAGTWYPLSDRIVIAGLGVLEGSVVRHEMLHAVTRTARHSPQTFGGSCEGLVGCGDACAREAGIAVEPRANAPLVPASELALTVSAFPSAPSMSGDSGWFASVVSVRNTRDVDVWVNLEPVSPTSPARPPFGYSASCADDCGAFTEVTRYSYSEGTRFGVRAGMTRRLAFDHFYPAATYHVRGLFNTESTEPVTVIVLP